MLKWRDSIYFLLFACIVAAMTDICIRKIPNLLILLMIIGGECFVFYKGGGLEVIWTLIYCLIVAILLYPFYMFKMLGAGDVKLYATLPVFIDKGHILQLYFLVFCVGAVLAVSKSVITSDGRGRIIHIVDILKSCIYLKCNNLRQVLSTQSTTIPMAVPLAIGILFSFAYRQEIFIF